MEKDRNKVNAIWIYAIVLFTSAFVVLLITAYSQIKFSKNISNYKSEITEKDSAINNMKFSIDEVKRLSTETITLKKQIDNFKLSNEESNIKNEKIIQDFSLKLDNYDSLINAVEQYRKNDLESTINYLVSINKELLNEKLRKIYDDLVVKAYYPEAKRGYESGYNYYINGDYNEAIKQFNYSIKLVKNEYYSDDIYYFLAYSHYRKNDIDTARKYMQNLIDKYPESNYKLEAEYFMRDIYNKIQ